MKKIVAIDTEFERKHTYRPILSIVQIREENKDPVIYDVYKKDNEQLIDLLEILANDDIIKVIHSARQDVEAIFYRFHIEMHNIFASNEEASKEFDHFKKHGDNAVLEGNKIIIKNAHDKDTLAGQLFGDGVGKTKDEFQTFLGYYECE